jgi:hypothetical protein
MSFKNYITEADNRVSKIIMSQINALDKWALASYGAKNYVSSKNSLTFDVRGSKFRGRVTIKLNRRDLYDIEYGTIRKMEYTIKHTDKNIFVEQLVNTLDNIIG